MEKNNSVFTVLFLMFINIVYSIMFGSIDLFIVSFVICICLLFVSKKIFKNGENYWSTITICWISGLLFIALVYIIYQNQFGEPYWIPGKDDYNFDVNWSNYALEKGYTSIAQMMEDKAFYLWNCNGYTLFITYLKRMAIFGYNTMIPRVINLGLLILDSLLMCSYIKNKKQYSNFSIKRMILIMSLFPNALFISSHVYRDQICAFMFVLCFYMWSDFFEKNVARQIIIVVTTLYLLYWGYWFRATNIAILLGIIALSLFNKDSWTPVIKKQINTRTVIIFSALICCGIFLLYRFTNIITQWFVRYNYVERYMINFGRLQKMIYSVPLLPFGWIFRIIYYLLSPFDSHALNFFSHHQGRDYLIVFISLGTLGIIFLYPYVIRGVFKRRNSLVYVFLGILFSCGLTTSGFRHMITFYPFMFVLGLSEVQMVDRKKRRNYMYLSSLVCILMVLSTIYMEL